MNMNFWLRFPSSKSDSNSSSAKLDEPISIRFPVQSSTVATARRRGRPMRTRIRGGQTCMRNNCSLQVKQSANFCFNWFSFICINHNIWWIIRSRKTQPNIDIHINPQLDSQTSINQPNGVDQLQENKKCTNALIQNF